MKGTGTDKLTRRHHATRSASGNKGQWFCPKEAQSLKAEWKLERIIRQRRGGQRGSPGRECQRSKGLEVGSP